jgi:cytoskeletal protein CcmA (bactofilin family)
MTVKQLSRWLLIVAIACVLVSCSEGDNSRDVAETVIFPASEIHEGWYFAAGNKVIIAGTINGDVFVAGGIVEVSGTVNGDLLLAGGDVTVSGVITDDIRAAGGTVRIEGKVGKNITAAGGNVSVGRQAEVSGDVLAFCGSLQLSGRVAGDLMIYAGTAAVSGNIGGDVTVAGEEFAILPGAKVAGNVRVSLGDKSRMKITDGTVTGTVDFVKSVSKHPPTILGYSRELFWFKIFWTVWLFLTGLVLFAFFRKAFGKYRAVLRQRTVAALLWGIAGIVVLPMVIVILAVTIVGLPFAILLFDLCIWLTYLSQLSTAFLVGDLIFRKPESAGWGPFLSFAAGLLIVQLLSFIPFVSWLIVGAGLLLGFGALALLLGEGYKSWRTSQPA